MCIVAKPTMFRVGSSAVRLCPGPESGFTHIRDSTNMPSMVDVHHKSSTLRTAKAQATLQVPDLVMNALTSGCDCAARHRVRDVVVVHKSQICAL